MKRVILAFLILLGGAAASRAQQTVVTATITDPRGTLYQFGTGFATLVCPGNQQPTIRGSPVPRTVTISGLDGFGTFVQKFFDVNGIDQIGCGYRFAITDQTTVFSFSTAVLFTVTGASVNLSTQISAFAVLLPINGGTGGTVTSVSNGGFAPLFTTNVATPTTTPAITYTAISQSANTFYAGPSGTATDLLDIAVTTATGTASPISITSGTPVHSGDAALLFTVRDGGGNAPNFTPDVSWTASVNNNATQEWFYKNVSGVTPATASGAIGTTSPNWSAALVLLTSNGSAPVVTHDSVIQSGAWSSFTNLAIGFTPTAGRTLVAVIMSGQTSLSGLPGPLPVATFTDSVGDVFVPLTYVVNNAGQGTQLTVLAATNIVGGATTFSNTIAACSGCALANGIAAVFEVTNLAPITPTFGPMTVRQIVGRDLPYPSPVSLGGVFTQPAIANRFLTSLNTTGKFGIVQPAFTDLGGVATGAQLPATTSNCTGNTFAQGLNAGFTPICTAAATTTVQVFTNQNLAGDVAVSANTLTTIDSVAVTMPASGGPWRAQVTYNYFFSGGVNGECTLSDGTTSWAQMEMQPLNNIGSCQDTAWSKTTYANGAVVTFTVNVWDTGATTAKATSNFHTAVASYIQVAIVK